MSLEKTRSLWNHTDEELRQQAIAAQSDYQMLLRCARIPRGRHIVVRPMASGDEFTQKSTFFLPKEVLGLDRGIKLVFDPLLEDQVLGLKLPDGRTLASLVNDRVKVSSCWRIPVVRWAPASDGKSIIAFPHCLEVPKAVYISMRPKITLDTTASLPGIEEPQPWFGDLEHPGRDLKIHHNDTDSPAQMYSVDVAERHVKFTQTHLDTFMAAVSKIKEYWYEQMSIAHIKSLIAGAVSNASGEMSEDEEDRLSKILASPGRSFDSSGAKVEVAPGEPDISDLYDINPYENE